MQLSNQLLFAIDNSLIIDILMPHLRNLLLILMRSLLLTFIFLISLFGNMQAEDAREYFKFAKFKYDNGEFTESKDFLDKALAQDSLYVNALYLRAETNYKLGNYYNSIKDVNNILRIEKNASSFTRNYYLTRGKSYLALNEVANATADFDKTFELSADEAEVYFYKAKIELLTDNFFIALENMNEAIRINPENPEYYAFRTEINLGYRKPLRESRGYHDILDDINQAISLSPDNYQYYQIRSSFLNSMGNSNEAEEDYNKMIELSPNENKAYTDRGVLNMNKYEYEIAAADFTKSILINPNDESNYRYRGLCYNNVSNYKHAYEDFTKSIDLQTSTFSKNLDNFKLKNVLAETYLLRGNCQNLMGNNALACRDFLVAQNLGIKKGLNYYRKFCAAY